MNSFADFLSMQQQMVAAQYAILNAQQQQFANVTGAANSLVGYTNTSANTYFYGLAAAQTQNLNNLGNIYANVAQHASTKMGRGGLLGLLGF